MMGMWVPAREKEAIRSSEAGVWTVLGPAMESFLSSVRTASTLNHGASSPAPDTVLITLDGLSSYRFIALALGH